MLSAASRHLLPGFSLLRRVALPGRSPEAPARAGRAAPTTSGELLVRSSSRARGMQRLRALVVCLSFAVCLPGTTRWELSWSVRAVATLVSAAMGVAALPRTSPAALAAQGAVRAAPAVAVMVLAGASPGALRAPPRWQQARLPALDGRLLYLDQCSLSC